MAVRIYGRVMARGVPKPSATVEVRRLHLCGPSTVEKTLTTDALGQYEWPGVPPGLDLEVRVVLANHKTRTSPGHFNVLGDLRVDFDLKPSNPPDYRTEVGPCDPEQITADNLPLLASRLDAPPGAVQRYVMAHRIEQVVAQLPGSGPGVPYASILAGLEAGMGPADLFSYPADFAAVRDAAGLAPWGAAVQQDYDAFRDRILGAPGTELGRLIDPTSTEKQRGLLGKAWRLHGGPIEVFLASAGHKELLFRRQLVRSLGKQSAIDSAPAAYADVGGGGAHAADLLGSATWIHNLAAAMGQAGDPITPDEVRASIERQYPIKAFAAQLGVVTSAALATAIKGLTSALDLRSFDLEQLPANLRPEATRLKRRYLIAPDVGRVQAIQVLAHLQIDGAHGVIRHTRAHFIDAVTGPLQPIGGQAPPEPMTVEMAGAIYDASEARMAGAVGVWSAGQGASAPAVVTEPAGAGDFSTSYPTLAGLVGVLDACGCAHCRSVLSPAAYLVELFRWLREAGELNKLFAKRPDLRTLELSCANTADELPYLQRVVEILEPKATGVSTDAWPLLLPRTTARIDTQVWLDVLELPAGEARRALQVSDWAPAVFGWSDSERVALLSPSTDAFARWGFSTDKPVGGFWYDLMAGVPEFLHRSGLDWQGLRQLLGTYAGGSLGLSPDHACSLDVLSITGLTVRILNDLHRVLHLAAHTGWSVWHTDLVLETLGLTTLDPPGLDQLAAFELLRRRTGHPIPVLCTWFGHLDARVDPISDSPSFLVSTRLRLQAPADGALNNITLAGRLARLTVAESLGISTEELDRLMAVASLPASSADLFGSPESALDFLADARRVLAMGLEHYDPQPEPLDSPFGALSTVDQQTLGFPSWGSPMTLEALARWQAARDLGPYIQTEVDAFAQVIAMMDTAQLFNAAGWPPFVQPESAPRWTKEQRQDPRVWLQIAELFVRHGADMLNRVMRPLELNGAWFADAAAARFTSTELEARQATAEGTALALKRDAFVAWLLANDAALSTEADLLKEVLIDAPTAACMRTSRLKEAISATQLFVHQGMLGVLPGVQFTASEVERWRWLKNYRVWEASRKIFLWPENWILPELRRDKTGFFQDYENALLQGDLTEPQIEQAFLAYVEGMRDVARLDIRAVTTEQKPDGVELLHVFGRTQNVPHRYFHRTWVNRAYWTPWSKLSVEIQGDHLLPVVYQGQLRLFWARFMEKTDEDDRAYWEIYLGSSTLRSYGWSAPQESPQPLSLGGRGSPYTADAPKQDYFFKARQVDGLRIELCQRVNLHQEAQLELDVRLRRFKLAVEEFGLANRDLTAAVANQEDSVELEDSVETALAGISSTSSLVAQQRSVRDQAPDDDRYFVLGVFAWDGCTDRLVPMLHLERQPLEKQGSTSSTTNAQRQHREPNLIGLIAKGFQLAEGVRNEEGEVRIDYHRIELTKSPVPDGESTVWCQKDEAFIGQRPFVVQGGERIFAVDPRTPPTTLPGGAMLPALLLPGFGSVTLFQLLSRAGGQDSDSRYRMVELDHPYACQIVEEVRRRGPFGVLDPEVVNGDTAFTYQSQDHPGSFQTRYQPTAHVIEPYPVETMDFRPEGAASIYNWELFFHLPFLTAMRLSAEGEYERATQWFHSIFDPRVQNGSTSAGYFKVKGLAVTPATIASRLEALTNGTATPEQQSKLEVEIARWLEDPFDPHSVAWLRPDAYQKAIILRYLEHLLSWADHLFRRDSIESIQEALPLYLSVSQLLGRRPVVIEHDQNPQAAPTWSSIASNLDVFSNALLAFELVVPPNTTGVQQNGQPLPLDLVVGAGSVFCHPQNPRWTLLWDWVEDRLFKIRNCMNIRGTTRSLALFEPPIDPGALVAGGLAGLDNGDVTVGQQEIYRYAQLVARARDLARSAQSFSDALQAALEKQDAETLANLRAEWQTAIHDLNQGTRALQADEARRQLRSTEANQESTAHRLAHYESLLEAGLLVSEWMQGEQAKKAHTFEQMGQVANALGAGLSVIPQFSSSGSAFGGQHLGAAANAVAGVFRAIAAQHRHKASLASLAATWKRRTQDWTLQRDLAAFEVTQLEAQVAAAELRVEIADREYNLARLQKDQAREEFRYLNSKHSSKALYTWMSIELKKLATTSYDLAREFVVRAEAAYEDELGLVAASVHNDVIGWDPNHRGAVAAHALLHRLDLLEASYLDANSRCHEITKRVSLARLEPSELLLLRHTGSCTLRLPEVLFDLDFPGHARRRLKAVTLTLPATVGPLTGVTGTLTLTKHWVRHGDGSLSTPNSSSPKIVLSSGQDDSGLFQLDFSDPRYLPFEYAGAISEWNLELSTFAQYDWRSIADAVLTLRYTAIDADDFAGQQAAANDRVNAWLEASAVSDPVLPPGAILLSLRHDLPDLWFRLIEDGQTRFDVPLEPWVPYGLRQAEVSSVELQLTATFEGAATAFDVTPSMGTGGTPIFLVQHPLNSGVADGAAGFEHGLLTSPSVPLSLSLSSVPPGLLDLFIVVTLKTGAAASGPAPVIPAGSQPWPGGTVTGTGGDTWYVDGVPTGVNTSTYSPVSTDVGKLLTRHNTSTNQDSNGLLIERIRGVNRLNQSLNGSKTQRLPEGSAPDVPLNGTLLAEVVLSTDGCVVSWMHWTAGTNTRRGVLLLVTNTGVLTARVYVGPNGSDASIITGAVPSLLDGLTKVLLGVRWTGTSFTAFYVDEGGVHTTAGSSSAVITQGNAGVTLHRTGFGSSFALPCKGRIEAAGLSASLTDAELLAIYSAGGLEPGGVAGRADHAWSARPASTLSEGDAIVMEGAGWTTTGIGVDNVAGGLNEPT